MKKALVVVLALSLVSCVFISRRVEVTSISTREPVTVSSPVKAHLKDGSTIVYPNGMTVTTDALVGEGNSFDLTLSFTTRVQRVPLADVLGVETFRTRVNAAESIVYSSLASAGAIAATAALAVAIFGSCPTVYSADGAVEEAELFSNSIAPLFEGRDIDRLHARADEKGAVRLDVRNEAMETHYINHLELLEVEHARDERAVSDADGSVLVVGPLRLPASAINRRGRDVRSLLALPDDRAYTTERGAIEEVSAADMDDWIDLSIPVEEGTESAALVFRVRNSLLSTILLYDVMLAPAGAAALDWLGHDLAKISTAVELGRWHRRRAGLHVSVWRDGAFRDVTRVPDSGPIMWDEVAVAVPVPAGERQLRIRVSFLADYWRLDQVRVSFRVRRASPRAIPLAGVTGRDGVLDENAVSVLRAPDEQYLQTSPGQRFAARFDTGAEREGRGRTFFLSSQGYYTEWIRGSWIEKATASEPFKPTDDAILAAIRRWGHSRESFEKQFRRARVPVQ